MKIEFDVHTEIDREFLHRAAKSVLWKAMNKIMEISTSIVPVDTGRLKNSLQLRPMSPGHYHYKFGDGVEYGKYVEFGTYKMAAQPFMRPAMDEVNAVWIPKFWEQELQS